MAAYITVVLTQHIILGHGILINTCIRKIDDGLNLSFLGEGEILKTY